jgi:hypothetical protein
MASKKQKEAYLYEKLAEKRVKYLNSAHYCIIAPGMRGACGIPRIS